MLFEAQLLLGNARRIADSRDRQIDRQGERGVQGKAEDEQGHWDLTRACSANVSDMRVDDI